MFSSKEYPGTRRFRLTIIRSLVTFATTELFLERLGLSSLTDLPDIAPLLPDIDMIDDLSESLEREPRFAKLNGGSSPSGEQTAFDVDRD